MLAKLVQRHVPSPFRRRRRRFIFLLLLCGCVFLSRLDARSPASIESGMEPPSLSRPRPRPHHPPAPPARLHSISFFLPFFFLSLGVRPGLWPYCAQHGVQRPEKNRLCFHHLQHSDPSEAESPGRTHRTKETKRLSGAKPPEGGRMSSPVLQERCQRRPAGEGSWASRGE